MPPYSPPPTPDILPRSPEFHGPRWNLFPISNLILNLLLLLLLTLPPLASFPARAQDPVEFFENRVRPVLAAECYECHGPDKQRGGLRLDHRQALLDGGDSGPALIPGQPEASLLIRAIRHDDPDLAMPPKRPPLGPSAIADLIEWIRQGAIDPRDQPASHAQDHTSWEVTYQSRLDWWSFQPLPSPPPKPPENTSWSPHPVDRFLEHGWQSHGLTPADPADRRTLLRRLSFALTGLPPTPEEIHHFLLDTEPGAWDRQVDRLLASPHFGERWARHWMDLVRYAESHGSEGDPEIPYAWRYRDYLVRAFNLDVPWNQLIREHLAGDLLPVPRLDPTAQRNESILGTAHLRLVEHGFQPVDTWDEQIKTIDNQIDVITKAFQGLTVSCARCHDHKFDPVGQRDFHAVFSVFASLRPTFVSIDTPDRLRLHRPELESLKDRLRSSLTTAWQRAARDRMETLLALALAPPGSPQPLSIPGDEQQQTITALQHRLDTLFLQARSNALHARTLPKNQDPTLPPPSDASTPAASGTGTTPTTPALPPTPIAVWTFDGDARDQIGDLHGTLHGAAVIRDGQLITDGRSAFVRTDPLPQSLSAKTLEAWVAPAHLDQRGGGVLGIETLDGATFDTLVFGEQQPRRWLAGSNGFARTQSVDGPEETAGPTDLVHLAIVYHPDHRIALYRNGMPYGTSYTPSGPQGTLRTFPAHAARVILGLRHTGGGNPYFAGAIEEARLYDQALSPEDIAASHHAGPGWITHDQILAAFTPDQRAERDQLLADLERQQAAFARAFPDYPQRHAQRQRLQADLQAALTNPRHPAHAWALLHQAGPTRWTETWQQLLSPPPTSNPTPWRVAWDLSGPDANSWFFHGPNPPEILSPGDFTVEPQGHRVLTGLLPAGIASHRLSQRHNGVLTSPRFRVDSDFISVLALGGKGARVRLVPDHYPLGAGNIFPQATLDSEEPRWIRLDTAYRRGTWAYLEFAPALEVTARDRTASTADGRSFFAVAKVMFHDPPELNLPLPNPNLLLLGNHPPASLEEFTRHLAQTLDQAISAWRHSTLTPDQAALLDAAVRHHWLPTSLTDLPDLQPLLDRYRQLDTEIPEPHRAPGVLETVGIDAPFLQRGNPHQPGEPVPRGYLTLLGDTTFDTPLSGRLELAEAIVNPANPLTARVLVNRIWHHLFGRGLVATPDNFGRLGEPPSHPELLDFLAHHFLQHEWSAKELIRFLVTSRTYQMSSQPHPTSRERDPANVQLSHMPVRRLEAEAIRDALLAVSGQMETTAQGPGIHSTSSPRRSLYLSVRRSQLPPFLEIFDAPRPFSTLGRRDATNVPAQSLALLNDPFVIELAGLWAQSLTRSNLSPSARLQYAFERALARTPTPAEQQSLEQYLHDLLPYHADQPDPEFLAWRDVAQSLFNLKEFIYLR